MTTENTQQESSLADDLAANVSYDEEVTPDAAVDDTAEVEAAAEAEEIKEVLEALQPEPKWDRRYKDVFNEWGAVGDDGAPRFEKGRDYQQTMLDLYKEQRGYATTVEQDRAKYLKERDQYKQHLDSVAQMINPYRDFFQSTGGHPGQLIPQGLGLLKDLRTDPQGTLLRLSREHNVDMQSALSEQPWQSPESKEIEALKQKLASFEQNALRTREEQAHAQMQANRAETKRQLDAFTEAKDESGNPLHPHLEMVQEQMATLIYGREQMRQQNPNMPKMGLEEAYEAACKLNPEVAQAEAEHRESERLAKADAEAKKAKEAAKHVKSGSSGKERSEKSLRDSIRENMVTA